MDSKPKAGPDRVEPQLCKRCYGVGKLSVCSCFMYGCDEFNGPGWEKTCPTLRRVLCEACSGSGEKND